MNKINLFGASGHAKVVADIASVNTIQIISIFDDNTEVTTFLNETVQTSYSEVDLLALPIILSIGNNRTRYNLSQRFKLQLAVPLIHPTAVISNYAKIGNGTVVMPNAVVNAGTEIGENCIINTGAIIEHDCQLEDFVHISPNATLAGGVRIQKGTQVGAGAIVIQCLVIGSWSIIGAGAVVTTDLPAQCTAVGVPARPVIRG